MKIDEKIAHEKETVEIKKRQYEYYMGCPTDYKENHKGCIATCMHSMQEHEQLAEWLEELKMLRELKDEHRKVGNIEGFNDGYNRAFDDFKEKINELEKSYKEKYGCEIVEMYSEIVSDLKGWIEEQLKR